MNPGIYPEIDIDEYHSGPGISKTGLDDIEASPFIFYSLHLDENRPPPKDRAGQFEGTLAHCAILEATSFDSRYTVIPEGAPRRPSSAQLNAKNPSDETIQSIIFWDEFECASGGKKIITQEQIDTAWRQRESVLRIPDICEALATGAPEQSAYWIDEDTGVLCRCRPDWVHPVGDDKVILVDVKTYSSAHPEEFRRQVARKRYHVQDAFYSDGYQKASGKEVIAFIFLAVETNWPHASCAVMLDTEGKEKGREEYRRNLRTYKDCLESGNWPSYSTSIEIISLPNWVFKE